MSLVTVTVDGAARHALHILNGRVIRDEAGFKESDHPRAADGKFGSGTKAHIVTSASPSDGTIDVHHVGTDEDDAKNAYLKADNEASDIDSVAELHAVDIDGKPDQRSDTLHIVHASDGAGGVDVHGAHLDYGMAQSQANDLSRSEWEENGPSRAEVGLSDLEKIDVAQSYNEQQEESGDSVRIKVDEDGDPILDDSGDFQFEQDGESVDLDEERQAELEDLSEDLFPSDEPAAYPGLEAANAHFTNEGRHESVFSVHTHEAA